MLDPRLQAVIAETGTLDASGPVVALAVNAVYGTAFDADGLRAQLATGLPAPP